MLESPIISRELRLALRKREAIRSRFLTALGACALVAFFMLIGWEGDAPRLARRLHLYLALAGVYHAVFPPLASAVGLFSAERRNRTLELLYLAGVGPGALFAGKLVGGLLIAWSNLLAITPMLAVPFLLGGVSLDLFLATLACFPALLLFILGIGVLASVYCRDEGAGHLFAAILGSLLCLATPLTYAIGYLLTGAGPFSSDWFSLSPAYGVYLVLSNFGGLPPSFFWRTFYVTIGWGALCLCLAGLFLRRSWRREIQQEAGRDRRTGWGAWIYGSKVWRSNLSATLLAINPWQWLVQQDRRPVAVAWAVVTGVAAAWLAGWLVWPGAWASSVNCFLAALLLVASLDAVMAYTAASRIARERREGSLEMLLTTRLRVEEIVYGEFAAMKAQFRAVRWTVIGCCLVLLLLGIEGPSQSKRGLEYYLFSFGCLLLWNARGRRHATAMAMWIGANSGRPGLAVFRFPRPSPTYVIIAVIFVFRSLIAMIVQGVTFGRRSVAQMILIDGVSAGVACLIFVAHISNKGMRNRLVKDLRSIARTPLPDARDPRFKRWNYYERLPRRTYNEMSEYVTVYPQRVTNSSRAKK